MEESERRHELTIIEKKMVVRCYTFLDKYKKEDCFARNCTRKLVELCIGMKEATVARVMQAYNENPDEVFQVSCDNFNLTLTFQLIIKINILLGKAKYTWSAPRVLCRRDCTDH
ncbi:hypothetical protein JG687_00018671 [Phytophthora cactorum]|uniref:Uncharacterized protein n=1 Tax=Phytophthora cactorum TaxID=29920 RepID=A0A8T1TP67_9STRA|nr:hypothetical protein JG687_00018671 [Phytophthora cactorum]